MATKIVCSYANPPIGKLNILFKYVSSNFVVSMRAYRYTLA